MAIYGKYGKLVLLTTRNNTGGNQMEPLQLRVFIDNSLVEIFANDRFALATYIYPSKSDSTGMEWFAQGGAINIQQLSVKTNLSRAWPARPADTSTTLVFDTAAQTNNYTWWSGN